MWDLTHQLDLYTPQFEKKLFFSGNASRFPHIVAWEYETSLHIFVLKEEGVDYSMVSFEGWWSQQDLLLELSKGGIGLVWGNSEDSADERDYYKENISYKLSTYLAAGIPVIVPDYLSNSDYICEKGVEFVVLCPVWKKSISLFKNTLRINIIIWQKKPSLFLIWFEMDILPKNYSLIQWWLLMIKNN